MATRTVVTTIADDEGNVISTSTESWPVEIQIIHSDAATQRIIDGIPVIETHLDAIANGVDVWDGLTAAQQAAAIGDVLLPAVRDALRGISWLARLATGQHDTEPPQ